MAIWQFDLSFAPRDGPLPWKTEDGHEVPALAAQQVMSAHTLLSEKVGVPWLMCEDLWVFGDDVNGNRVDLLLNEDGSGELFARIDVRARDVQFEHSICALARQLVCILFSAEFWEPVDPDLAQLSAAIERSRAQAYVVDPVHVISGRRDAGEPVSRSPKVILVGSSAVKD